MASKRTWGKLKTAAAEAAGTAWTTVMTDDPRYITFMDPATLRTVQAYHADGLTVVQGRTVSLREAASRLADELENVHGFGALGSFDRLRGLAPPEGQPGRPQEGRAVHVRIPEDMLAYVDDWAQAAGISRAEVLRIVIHDRMAQKD